MNTTIKHGSLAALVIGLLMAGCGPDGSTLLEMISGDPDTISEQAVSASFTPIPLETFTVTNIHRGAEATLIGWAADDLPVYAIYGDGDGIETLAADYVYLVGYGELVSHTH